MAISTYASYLMKCKQPQQLLFIVKTSSTSGGCDCRTNSAWTTTPNAGTAPGAAAVPSMTIAGAIGQVNPSGILRLVRVSESASSYNGAWILADRLSHQSGLSGTATGAQNTNLPTAALTRYTSGVGVMAMLEIYTAIGTSGATVTISYTDQDNNSGITSEATPFGITNFSAARRAVIMPLAAGDTGVRAVGSVTLSGSTGTAGDFGVTLFKPLAIIPHFMVKQQCEGNNLLNLCGLIPKIETDACLFMMPLGASTSGSGHPVSCSALLMAEE